MKTTMMFDWEHGYRKRRQLSRSFNTLEQAEKFAEGKQEAEIYRSKGQYKVEWVKITQEE